MTSATTASAGTAGASAIVATAQQYLGYAYASVGDTPSTGFSCIGFVHFVFAQNGVDVPEDLGQAYASAPRVDQSQLQPGDLVFFQNTVWNGISHVDIYIGGGMMIGADTFQTGVHMDTLSDAYWQDHYLGATRPLSALSGAPVAPTAAPVAPSAPVAPTAPPLTPSATPVPSETTLAPASASLLSLKAGMTVTTLHDAPVYSAPSDAGAALDTVSPPMPLTVIQIQGPWVNVSYDGGNQYGWVYGNDLNPRGAGTAGSSSGSTGAQGRNASQTRGLGTRNTSTMGTTLVVRSPTAMVYSSPLPSGSVLGTLIAGTAVTVLQTQGQWDQIALLDQTAGWVTGSVLSAATAPDTRACVRTTYYGGNTPDNHDQRARRCADAAVSSSGRHEAVVTADVLFVRDGPSRHARILGRVYAGDHLSIVSTLHGWNDVIWRNGARGWVSAQWVQAADAA